MSDRVGVRSDLEEIFLAREFGRFTVQPLRAVEEDLAVAPEPRGLEEVFLSRDFGRPVALELVHGDLEPAPNVVEFPFAGPGATPFDPEFRQRAVAALSGVAAAALVIAGLLSAGGQHAPTTSSALGRPSLPGGSAVSPDHGAPAPTLPAGPGSAGGAVTGSSASSSVQAVFAARHVTTPVGSAPAPGAGSTSAPAAGGQASPPPPPPPPSGGTVPGLAPANVIVGDLVSAAGSSVTAASGQVAAAVPHDPGLTTTVAQTGNDVSLLGESIATPTGL